MKQGEESEENKQEIKVPEQVLKLIADLQKEVASLKGNQSSSNDSGPMSAEGIATIVKAALSKDKDIDYEGGIREEQIPVDDFDDKGVRFCAPLVGYVVTCDKRNGHRVVLPYGKKQIFFEYTATRRMQQGKYEAVAPYSIYHSHSKKEIEWLRKHSLFNVMFYETSTQAVNADVEKMQKLSRIMIIIQTYELPDLIKRCKDYNIAISEDAQSMRSNLAWEMLNSEMDVAKKVQERMVEQTFKEAALLKK